jgi:hypothetical protein
VEDRLSNRGFDKFVSVKGRYSIADLVPNSRRTGIYVFQFSDGAFYAGQSIDIPQRFAQHRAVHPDIELMCWKAVERSRLDDEERETIRLLEAHKAVIRNVQYASLPLVGSAFEAIMPNESQARFLSDVDCQDLGGIPVAYPELMSRTETRFAALKRSEGFANLTKVLGKYLSSCVPSPRKTEVAHWAVSCGTSRESRAGRLVCRVNVGWQEVLTVWEEQGQWDVWFQARRSIIGRTFPELLKFRRRHLGCVFYRNAYLAGGTDQLRIASAYFDDTMALLDDPAFILAARHLNVTLATKSGCMWSRSHCPQLVDAAFAAVRASPA